MGVAFGLAHGSLLRTLVSTVVLATEGKRARCDFGVAKACSKCLRTTE